MFPGPNCVPALQIAEAAAGEFRAEWEAPIQGLATLDQMLGKDHGLLGEGPSSYGLTDGIWEHDGWQPMREVCETCPVRVGIGQADNEISVMIAPAMPPQLPAV